MTGPIGAWHNSNSAINVGLETKIQRSMLGQKQLGIATASPICQREIRINQSLQNLKQKLYGPSEYPHTMHLSYVTVATPMLGHPSANWSSITPPLCSGACPGQSTPEKLTNTMTTRTFVTAVVAVVAKTETINSLAAETSLSQNEHIIHMWAAMMVRSGTWLFSIWRHCQVMSSVSCTLNLVAPWWVLSDTHLKLIRHLKKYGPMAWSSATLIASIDTYVYVYIYIHIYIYIYIYIIYMYI